MTVEAAPAPVQAAPVQVAMPTVYRGQCMSILLHSDTKVGKTTFGATSPKPMLLLDAEMAYRFLPNPKVFWDPMTQAPPVYDGTWEICVVLIREYSTFVRAYEWLASGQHNFISVVIDSISEIQTRCKDQLLAQGADKFKLWGGLLDHMEKKVREFRDLTEHPTRPLSSIVITSMTQQRDGKWRPYVQGQLQTKMPYFLDVIGYLYVQEIPATDPTQASTKIRRMLVTPHPQFEAGERVQGRLGGDVVDNPTVVGMLNMVFGEGTSK